MEPRVFEAGGLERAIKLQRLPEAMRETRMTLQRTVKVRANGDTRLYVRVQQETDTACGRARFICFGDVPTAGQADMFSPRDCAMLAPRWPRIGPLSLEAAMPKIDIAAVPARKGSGYPPPFDAPCAERVRQRLGNAGGLTDFGVNLMRLPPGNWSSQRHWHSHEDEFVYVLEGELTLIEDGGETVLRAGDCAAFAKGSGNGHHLINRSAGQRFISKWARARRPTLRPAPTSI